MYTKNRLPLKGYLDNIAMSTPSLLGNFHKGYDGKTSVLDVLLSANNILKRKCILCTQQCRL